MVVSLLPCPQASIPAVTTTEQCLDMCSAPLTRLITAANDTLMQYFKSLMQEDQTQFTHLYGI